VEICEERANRAVPREARRLVVAPLALVLRRGTIYIST
jgi:hypothetical protein